MKRFIPLFCGLVLVLSGGCRSKDLLERFTSPEDEAAARNYIELLREDQFDQIHDAFDPQLPLDHDTFEKMRALIPAGEPVSTKVVGCWTNINKTPGSATTTRSVNMTFEFQFPKKWLLINVAVRKEGDVSSIVGFNVHQIPDSLENLNRFASGGKGEAQQLMLALMCVVALLTLCALIVCIRTKMKKRKWLWVIFILLGVGRLTVNWTTGNSYFSLFSLQLFGVGANAEPYGPWMLSVSLPLGAMVFLIRRRLVVVWGKTES